MIPALAIDVLAVCRLTRLITKDTIAEPIRDAWVAEAYERDGREPRDAAEVVLDPDPPKMAVFITCPWCTSMWIALGVVAARRLAPRLWDPLARALAMSHLAGLGANLDVE